MVIVCLINKSSNNIKSRNVESSKNLLFQSDYVLPIFEKSRLEMCITVDIRRINSDYKVWDNAVLVNGLNNLLHDNEKIYGSYLQYGNREKKFQYAVGVRIFSSRIANNKTNKLKIWPTM